MATTKKTASRLTPKKLLSDMPTKELKDCYYYIRQIRYACHHAHYKAGNLALVKKFNEFEQLCLDELNERNPNIRRK